jgi:hypothetical protein
MSMRTAPTELLPRSAWGYYIPARAGMPVPTAFPLLPEGIVQIPSALRIFIGSQADQKHGSLYFIWIDFW